MPFRQVDLLIQKVDNLIAAGHADPFVKSNLAALIGVVCVTSFELKIKKILIDFSQSQHALFGFYVESNLTRINGRITIGDIKGLHLAGFGSTYSERFDDELTTLKDAARTAGKPDPASDYDSLINARHKFVHQNRMPDYDEVKSFYLSGIQIMAALERAMGLPRQA